MQRELTQLSSDTELLKRELDRSLGFSHWSDPRWKPKRIPVWALDVHRSTLERFQKDDLNTRPWQDWYSRLLRLNTELSTVAEQLFVELQNQNQNRASELYPQWVKQLDMLQKEVEWAKREIDSETRLAFKEAQAHVQNLRLALQLLLLTVIGMALVVVWMGERALRPIGHLRKVVQLITERGVLTSEAKAGLPIMGLSQKDEVSALAREFHQMATTVIEREKTIDFQKDRLEEQNKALLQMGELQKRLQQAEHLAAVGRLSAQVAHEVGNPLHSIGLETELALEMIERAKFEKSAHAISLKQSMQSILSSVERLQKIIQNYLKLSRLTPGTKKPIELKEVLEATLATYANSLEKLKVRVTWNFDEEATHGQVVGDAELIEYAMGNLMRNSLQALETVPAENRMIYISLQNLDGKRVYFNFEDSGPGIPEEIQGNLFKPFFTTKAQGTGLGLSFVKKVFNDLGGDFYLKPHLSDIQGTRFEGYFPLLSKHAQISPEAQA
ncbi:MAG: GHKL domain-containing protein [Bdellovibrionales bacterium]|nr:GHKL domain-containing protein [Oligoflexia bacterium]